MGISKLLNEIEKLFHVYGYIGKQWEAFQKNVTYDGFLIERKEFVILEEQTEYYMNTPPKENKKIIHVYDDRDVDYELININTSPAVLRKMEEMRKTFEKAPPPKDLSKLRK